MDDDTQNIDPEHHDTRQEADNPRRERLITMILVMAVALLVGVGVALVVLNQEDEASDGTVVNNGSQRPLRTWEAADFTLETLDGETVQLSDFEGRPVFLNFWATWCAPCRRELPAFMQFMSEQTADGPVILTVNQGETEAQVQEFLAGLGISGITVLMDRDLDLMDLYPSGNLPTTYVIDAAGFVRFTHYGEVTHDDLYNYLAELETGIGG